LCQQENVKCGVPGRHLITAEAYGANEFSPLHFINKGRGLEHFYGVTDL